jgi:hypothetical protein
MDKKEHWYITYNVHRNFTGSRPAGSAGSEAVGIPRDANLKILYIKARSKNIFTGFNNPQIPPRWC